MNPCRSSRNTCSALLRNDVRPTSQLADMRFHWEATLPLLFVKTYVVYLRCFCEGLLRHRSAWATQHYCIRLRLWCQVCQGKAIGISKLIIITDGLIVIFGGRFASSNKLVLQCYIYRVYFHSFLCSFLDSFIWKTCKCGLRTIPSWVGVMVDGQNDESEKMSDRLVWWINIFSMILVDQYMYVFMVMEVEILLVGWLVRHYFLKVPLPCFYRSTSFCKNLYPWL